MATREKVGKKTKLLQRLIDAVGDCEDTAAILEIVEEANALLHPRYCSFCKKSQNDVKYLVVANKDTAICESCIDLAKDIIIQKSDEDNE